MPRTLGDAVTSQEQSDREFAQSFSEAARQNRLVFFLRVQIGVLEQQIKDERMNAFRVVAVVAIACFTLGRLI